MNADSISCAAVPKFLACCPAPGCWPPPTPARFTLTTLAHHGRVSIHSQACPPVEHAPWCGLVRPHWRRCWRTHPAAWPRQHSPLAIAAHTFTACSRSSPSSAPSQGQPGPWPTGTAAQQHPCQQRRQRQQGSIALAPLPPRHLASTAWTATISSPCMQAAALAAHTAHATVRLSMRLMPQPHSRRGVCVSAQPPSCSHTHTAHQQQQQQEAAQATKQRTLLPVPTNSRSSSRMKRRFRRQLLSWHAGTWLPCPQRLCMGWQQTRWTQAPCSASLRPREGRLTTHSLYTWV